MWQHVRKCVGVWGSMGGSVEKGKCGRRCGGGVRFAGGMRKCEERY